MEYRAVTKFDPSKELTHWKYIKRYRQNGEWRYVYADEDVHKEINRNLSNGKVDKEAADRFVEKKERMRREHESEIDRIRKEAPLNERISAVNKYIRSNPGYWRAQDYASELIDNFNESSERYYRNAYEIIRKNSIRTLASETVNKGKNFIRKLFKKK